MSVQYWTYAINDRRPEQHFHRVETRVLQREP